MRLTPSKLTQLIIGFFAYGALLTAHASLPPALTWSVPTVYADKTILPSTDIAYYTLSWIGANGIHGTLQIDAKATSQLPPATCGVVAYFFTVTTTPTARYPNTTSGMTGPLFVDTGVECQPEAPIMVLK